tara:strand:+ start:1194 stop:1514 length:321 start_codon:yes stop_codon:yes gene_type:complete
MKKQVIYEWLYHLTFHHNGGNQKQSIAFAKNYIDDKIALDYVKTQYKNLNLKHIFEQDIINSIKKQNSIKFTKDKKMTNYKSTFCCETIYHGNKKKCDHCNQNLKF